MLRAGHDSGREQPRPSCGAMLPRPAGARLAVQWCREVLLGGLGKPLGHGTMEQRLPEPPRLRVGVHASEVDGIAVEEGEPGGAVGGACSRCSESGDAPILVAEAPQSPRSGGSGGSNPLLPEGGVLKIKPR